MLNGVPDTGPLREGGRMPIDLASAAQKYATVTPQMANVWQARAQAAAQEWEQKAKSPETEAYWQQRVIEAAQNQARLKGLMQVSAADYAAGVAAGAEAYRSKVSTVAPQRWQQKFAPYAEVIDRVVATLPAKTTDVAQNVMNRVVPIATALRQAKVQGAVTRVFGGTPTPTMTMTSPFVR